MTLSVTPSGRACGARIEGVDLTSELSSDQVAQLRAIWLEHKVVAFPNQALSPHDLERVAQYFGPIGDDPYFAPIEGHDRIAAVRREADETAPLFAEVWHSDWSFMRTPPAATCLYGLDIPPVGGDTLFANEHKAWEEMPEGLRQKFLDKMAVLEQTRKGSLVAVLRRREQSWPTRRRRHRWVWIRRGSLTRFFFFWSPV